MGFIELSTTNLATEHICCAISDKREESGLSQKKAWLNERLSEGLTFRKLDQRGKVFIEYLPAEKAWAPVDAPGYLYINCLWVSGSFKGKGYGKELISSCIADAGDCSGIVALSSAKKRPFLSDGKFLKQAGFTICDEANPYFELLVFKTNPSAPDPQFLNQAKNPIVNFGPGLDLFYTAQCPFAPDYAGIAANLASEKGLNIRIHHIDTREKAVQHTAAWSTYSLFKDGHFHTHEIQTAAKLEALARS
ncbi:MAG: YoaP domain-containing protein [Bacteroidales bacterium]|nr:YoaP domain-containing protein [Bacteroidales bacterium]